MKVKNIMFSGFAAAILMGVAAEANAATKVVASKGYVDAIAGQLDGLNTSAKSNLVEAINELKNGKQEKFTDGAGGSTTTGFISSVTQTGGAVTANATAFDTEINDDTKGNQNTAPTTKAVADAIQGVSQQIQTLGAGVDINIDEDNKINATYATLDYDNLTDTAMNANKLSDGYSIVSVKQVDGKLELGAKQYIDSFNEYSVNETQAPMTKAVYNALQGKQNTLTAAQQAAVDSGITAEQVATFAAKQNALTTAQQDAVDSGITADKVQKYDSYGDTKQDKLTAGKFINIANDGTITTTYSAGDNIVIGTDGKISTDFPDMPDACSATGVTCVLTSEGGVFAWAILAQPYSYASGDEDSVERITNLGYAAQDQKIPEQLYNRQ